MLCPTYHLHRIIRKSSLPCAGYGGQSLATIPRAKKDPFGDGRSPRSSADTVEVLEKWLERSGISRGLLFRRLHTGKIEAASMEIVRHPPDYQKAERPHDASQRCA